MNQFAIGTDIGGSHICSVAIDLEKKSILKESLADQEVDNQASAEEILGNWAAAINKSIAAIRGAQLTGIGFAMPGPFDYAKGIALFTSDVAKYQNLHGINIAERIKNLLAWPDSRKELDLRFLNDATAFGVGEAWLGKASGARRSIVLTLGTGLGAAFIEDGIPVVDGADVPRMGSMWHLPFNGNIADDSFSARWFINRYAEKSGTRFAGVKQIAERVERDPQAKEIFVEFGANLGIFLGPWLKKFSAEVLVLGGNVSAAYPWFGPALEESLKNQHRATTVHLSELKEHAALIGSARLLEEKFWSKAKPLLPKMCL
jgi:glucokinase